MSGTEKLALIFGAGKIGRGFAGQLLHRSGYRLVFVDKDAAVVDLLNREKAYRVDIAGRPAASEFIPVHAAYAMEHTPGLRQAALQADVIFSCVGARNLDDLAYFAQPLLEQRELGEPLSWFILENADSPARHLRAALLEKCSAEFHDFVEKRLGLVETQVLRTGMPADASLLEREPLALRMQDWWTLPADGDAIRGEVPPIQGLMPKSGFAHELLRKVYTFNGLNGPIATLGLINGYRLLHEAARAQELQETLRRIQAESTHGLIAEFAFDEAEHRTFQEAAWNKYRDPDLGDTLERNVRDLARKLGSGERLVGPAALCLKHGREPIAYAAAIAAALAWKGGEDTDNLEVRRCVETAGPGEALRLFSGLDPTVGLGKLIMRAWNERSYLFSRRGK